MTLSHGQNNEYTFFTEMLYPTCCEMPTFWHKQKVTVSRGPKKQAGRDFLKMVRGCSMHSRDKVLGQDQTLYHRIVQTLVFWNISHCTGCTILIHWQINVAGIWHLLLCEFQTTLCNLKPHTGWGTKENILLLYPLTSNIKGALYWGFLLCWEIRLKGVNDLTVATGWSCSARFTVRSVWCQRRS